MTEDRTTPRKQQRRLSLLQSFLVVVLPIIIASVLYDPTTVVTGLIHLHFVHWPTRIWPLDNPERDFGLVGARNYRIRSGDAELGLWHVPPADGNKGKRVVVYFHGQAGAREHGHRVELYRHLSRDMDTHVVTADLRGYGDSAGFPFVEGITEDIKTVTDWAIDNVARKLDIPIYMYGHSLGGPQAVYAALHALDREQKVNGVILESTFSSFEEVAADHISTWFLWIFPRSIRLDIIRWGFSFALQGSDFRFDTARLLQDLRRRDPSIPIVSFHGETRLSVQPRPPLSSSPPSVCVHQARKTGRYLLTLWTSWQLVSIMSTTPESRSKGVAIAPLSTLLKGSSSSRLSRTGSTAWKEVDDYLL